MNIEGNKVIWQNNNIAVADTTKDGFCVYRHITRENGDGTAFRFWNRIDSFSNSDEAISFAQTLK